MSEDGEVGAMDQGSAHLRPLGSLASKNHDNVGLVSGLAEWGDSERAKRISHSKGSVRQMLALMS